MAETGSHVLWELVQTAHLASVRFGGVFADCGLTPAQYGVLASLADGDDLSQADLARAVLVRPQTMGRLVTGMVDQGLVVRRGPPGRGRRTGLAMTAEGRRRFARARPAAYRLTATEVTGLDDDQSEALIGLLRTVRQQLGQPSPAPRRHPAAAVSDPGGGG